MTEIRKPAPMTPDRARDDARRCRLVAGCAFAAAAVIFGFGGQLLAVIPAVLAGMFLREAWWLDGWRDGYLAREREERARAGGRR